MAYDIQTIDRSGATADALRGKAEKDGYELYEANRKHYLLRRPKDYAPPAPPAEPKPEARDEPKEEPDEKKKPKKS